VRSFLATLGLTVFLAGIAAAHADVPEGCVTLGTPRKVSSMCDFKKGVPMFYTPVRTTPIEGCPADLTVLYLDPQTQKLTSWEATRKGTTIETCGSGVTAVKIKQASHARTSPSPRPQAAAPSKKVYWNAVAGGIWKVNGAVQVAIGYSGARNSASEAQASALRACSSAGQNCQASKAFNSGCFYITTGRNSDSAGWVASYSSSEASARCNAKYSACKTPIGGCVE